MFLSKTLYQSLTVPLSTQGQVVQSLANLTPVAPDAHVSQSFQRRNEGNWLQVLQCERLEKTDTFQISYLQLVSVT